MNSSNAQIHRMMSIWLLFIKAYRLGHVSNLAQALKKIAKIMQLFKK